jgi:3-deoxy-D-manno-octulosonate 8-phosphate phosphatase (KDO 8-P phosphatase)
VSQLLKSFQGSNKDVEQAKPIRLILSDVDGVLTDGAITIDNAGVESKTFNVRDGLGIRIWQRQGFMFGMLTARNSQIVKLRAAELNIELLRQGFLDKLPVARELFQLAKVSAHEVCYVGDDLPDLPVLKEVGLPVAVADAAPEVCSVAKWVLQQPGGKGAVRELIERLLKAKGLWEPDLPVVAKH